MRPGPGQKKIKNLAQIWWLGELGMLLTHLCGCVAGILFLRHFRSQPFLGRMIYSMLVCFKWFLYWFCISLVSYIRYGIVNIILTRHIHYII